MASNISALCTCVRARKGVTGFGKILDLAVKGWEKNKVSFLHGAFWSLTALLSSSEFPDPFLLHHQPQARALRQDHLAVLELYGLLYTTEDRLVLVQFNELE